MGFDIKKVAKGISLPFGLGSLLGSEKDKVPTASFDPQVQRLEQSAEKRRGIISGAYDQLPGLTDKFKTGVGEATMAARNRRNVLAQNFLNQVGQGKDAESTQAFNLMKQQVLGAVPELQRAAREGAAATGGLQRGAAVNMVNQPIQQAQQTLGQGAQQLALASQQTRNQVLQDIFSSDRAFELQNLGIDMNTAQTLLDMGRGDILNEALQLSGIEADTVGDIVNLQAAQQETNIASELARQQRQAALTAALLGAGGQIAGGFAGRA